MKSSLSRRGFLRSFSRKAAGGGVAWAAATAGPVAAANPSEARSLPLPAAGLTGSSRNFFRPQKVLLWESTRKEVRESLSSGQLKAAIVPTGSTEQHNEHLALITAAAVATLVAQQAALTLYPKAIVSTPCPVGYSPYHMARKGTLTLRKKTFLAYVFDCSQESESPRISYHLSHQRTRRQSRPAARLAGRVAPGTQDHSGCGFLQQRLRGGETGDFSGELPQSPRRRVQDHRPADGSVARFRK